ncbi:MAG: Calx-beta domain-containing protein [Desulfotomaculaceae bacterium]
MPPVQKHLHFSNGQFKFANVSFTFLKNAGTVTISVYRNWGANSVASMVYATSNGTATSSLDYSAVTGTLSFADGEHFKTFTVTIIEDDLYENTETVNLTLKNPTGGATLDVLKSAIIRITNNDNPNGEIEFD